MAKPLSSKDATAGDNSSGMIDGEALRRYVSRCVALMEQRAEISADMAEVYEEAKEAGFVTKQLRQLVKEQMMEPLTLESHLEAMDALRHALGGLAEMPLGAAAVKSATRKPRQTEVNLGELAGSA